MVTQTPDGLRLDEQELLIVAVNGVGLFDPHAYGLKPAHAYQPCWRGYLSQYSVTEGRLLLDDLRLCLMAPANQDDGPAGQPGPAINGVAPRFAGRSLGLNNTYDWLHLPVPFTGGLLAAAGLVEERYIQLGFQPAWHYKTVMELLFENGALTQARDVSLSVAALRVALSQSPLLPNAHLGQDSLRAWIASVFRLQYNL
jgi:hypothetical protein